MTGRDLTEGAADSTAEAAPEIEFRARTKSFTRRGRRIHSSLQRTMDAHAHRYVIEPTRDIGQTTVSEDFHLDLPAVFGRTAPVTVEIGPGVGEQLVAAAQRWPDRDFLGFEVYQPGIAKLVSRAAAAGVDNLRILEADAQQAIPIVLDPESVAEVWTFFPDPWRKARHRKRRLVSDAFAPQIARILPEGGIWRLATDWDDYAWQMRDVIEASADFTNPFEGERPDPADPEPERGGFAPRFEGRVLTHFEQRGRDAGRHAHDIVGVRV